MAFCSYEIYNLFPFNKYISRDIERHLIDDIATNFFFMF